MSRPQSAQSKTAWGHENDGSRDGESPNDSALDDSQTKEMVKTKQEPVGVFGKFKHGIRSLWATRMSEDTDDDRKLYIKTTLRELILYLIFLVILSIITFCMTGTLFFYYTKVMTELFVDSESDGATYQDIGSMEDFWTFSENALLDGLYWEKHYNEKNVSENDLGYVLFENKLLGVPRLRMLRVKNDSCDVYEDLQQEIKWCYNSYSEGVEDRNPFGLYGKNGSLTAAAWEYQSEAELDGSSHWGQINTYRGGGFVQDLKSSRDESAELIDELKQNLWLDRGTRAVFIDFTVYNANLNLFSVVRLLVEFPATGGAIPSWVFRTVKLLRYVTALDYFVLACECIFALFIVYYAIEESIEVKKHKLKYFKSFWNILDILVIVLSIICIAFNIYRTMAVDKKLDALINNPNQFPDFEFLSYWQVQFNSAIAITVFMSWAKIFKYISFNKTMTQLSSTLARCAKDLMGFAIMFFIVFLAFAQLGYLLFGTQVQDFSSFGNSIFTLFRIILGDFNFHDLEQANRILGPAYFIVYVFFVFFVLLNMFLAIINDTYSEIKAEIAEQREEYEMSDYFKEGYNKVMQKLNLKRDKVFDMQTALKTADENNDGQVDFREWRKDLKSRGYADDEIEAVFAKYDSNHDRVLDITEQKHMHEDLKTQKDALNEGFNKPKGQDSRPGTGCHGSSPDNDGDDSRSRKGAGSRVGSAAGKGGDGDGGGGGGDGGLAYDEFNVLVRRVDRMEHSIGSIVSKIDAVLVKLEAMERAKSNRRETMTKMLDSITQVDPKNYDQRAKMEKMVKDELERWDSKSSLGHH